MKRLIGVTSLALLAVALFARSALAGDCGGYPTSPCDTPTVLPTVVHHDPRGGTAFTGADLGVGFAILAGLVVIGLVALFAARKRAAKA